MIVRIRSRDGLERVTLDGGATLADLRSAVAEQLKVPVDKQAISLNADLLRGEQGTVPCLEGDAPLSTVGVAHGTMLYLRYDFERQVASRKRSAFESRPFGVSMNVEQLIAKQTRIERQELATCASVSMERGAANAFQLYVSEGFGFSIKRGGYMYGTVDDEKNVTVEFVYEPSQDGNADDILVVGFDEQRSLSLSLSFSLSLSRVYACASIRFHSSIDPSVS